MMNGLGPRARRVYVTLRDRITHRDWPPGTRLPSHRELAVEFGVAPMTMRQVLGHLAEQGLVSRQVGRGTFVLDARGPAIIIIEPDPTAGAFLAEYVRRAGYRPLLATYLADALTALATDAGVTLALCALRAPTIVEGQEIIATLHTRYPRLLVAAVVTELGDLAGLFGTAAWPLHILPQPINLGLLDSLLQLVAQRAPTVE